MAVSVKTDPIGSSIYILRGRSAVRGAILRRLKIDLKKVQLGNCDEEKSSFLLEGALYESVATFKNNKVFPWENSEFFKVVPKREKVFTNRLFAILNGRLIAL